MRNKIIIVLLWIFMGIPNYGQQAIQLFRDHAANPITGGLFKVFNAPNSLPKYSIKSDDKGRVYIPDLISARDSFYLVSGADGWAGRIQNFLQVKDSIWILILPSDLTHSLENVVFSAGRFQQKLTDITVSMELVKPRQLERTNVIKLDGILEQVPGVTVINGQANIRGGSGFAYGAGSRVLLMVDDLPMLSADAGDIKWDFIPLENVQQIEVLKGASSALYGSGAMGGVIHIRTRKPSNKPFTRIQVSTGLFSNPPDPQWKFESGARFQHNMSFYHSRRFRGWDIGVGGYWLKDDGYRFSETYDNRRLNLLMGRRGKNWDASIHATGFHLQGGNFLFWANLDSAYFPNLSTISIMNNKRLAIDPVFRWSAGAHQWIYRGRYFLTDNRNTTGQGSKAALWFQEIQWQHSGNWKKIKVTQTAGLVYSVNQTQSEGLYGNHQGYNQAIYYQQDVKILKWNLNAGIRYERNKVDRLVPSGLPVFRFGFSHPAGKAGFIRGSWGTAYRYPSVAERYTFTRSGAIAIFPNPNILSETGYSVEIGYKQGIIRKRWQGFLDVALFQTQYQNMVDFVFGYYPSNPGGPFDPNYLGFQTRNVQQAQITGVELSQGMEYRHSTWGQWVVQYGYTFIQPLNNDTIQRNRDDPERFLRYRFRHMWKVNVDWNKNRWSAGFTWRFQSHMLNIDSVLEKPVPFTTVKIIPGVEEYRKENQSGFGLWDLRCAYQLNSRMSISLIVKNAENRSYMFFPGNMGAPRMVLIQWNGKW